MASIISPNMSLTIPTVGSQPGPDYAFNVNASLTLIDQHDHSPGRGVQITPAGMNINTTFDVQSNNVININDLVFTAQSSSSTLQALYVAPGTESPAINDLFFNDGSGNIIQITAAGTVNATIGSLPGESYAAGTFFWKQGTGSTTPANFDIGSITLRPNIAATTFGVTLTPPAGISSSYSVALPALPISSNKIMSMDTSGNMYALIDVDNSSIQLVSNILAVKALGIQTSMINVEAVTEPKLADNSVSTRTIVDAAVTKVKLNADVRLESQAFNIIVPSFTVRVATTVNGTFATAFDNGSVIDGVTLATNDLILIKNQTAAADNGVYVVQASGNPVRSTSYDTAAEINYAAVNVTAGTTNAGTKYFQNNVITTIGVDAQSWSLSSSEAFIVPAGVTLIDVLMTGGGGGGGSGNGSNKGGGTGGGGSLPQISKIITIPGETLNIQIGNGGRGGHDGAGGAGADGGNTIIYRGATALFRVVGSTGGPLSNSTSATPGVSTALNITGSIVGSGASGAQGLIGTAGLNDFYAVGGAGGAGGASNGGGGGGGGGAGYDVGGAGGIGQAAFSGTPGGTGSNGSKGSGGGGGGSSSNASNGGNGGYGGNGYVLISYF